MLVGLPMGTEDAHPYAPWWTKYEPFWPFYDRCILIEAKTAHPAQKTSFVFIYGGIAPPSYVSWTANGDGRCISVCTVLDKVWAFLAILRWMHFNWGLTWLSSSKTSFVFIYGGIALPSYLSWTANGDRRCKSVCIVVEKVWAFLAVLRWMHINWGLNWPSSSKNLLRFHIRRHSAAILC